MGYNSAPPDSSYYRWHDSADTSASNIVNSGGKVSEWKDKSSGTSHVTQATADKQPVTDSVSQNGRNVLDFDGVDDYLISPEETVVDQPNTLIFYCKIDIVGLEHLTDSVGTGERQYVKTQTQRRIDAGETYVSGVPDTDPHLHLIEFNGTSSKFFFDGVQEGTTHDLGTEGAIGITIAARKSGVNNLDGWFGDVLCYPGILSTSGRDDAMDWFQRKFGAIVTAAPANPGVVAGDEENTISWDDTHGETSYDLYWSTSTPVTTGDTKITGETSGYSHTGLTNGTQYYYCIVAQNDAGESLLSTEVSGTPAGAGSPPDAPTNPLCVIGNAQNTISWDAPADTDSYKLYWKLSSPVTTGDNEIVLGDVLTYLHTGRTNGTDYFYAVLAVNEHGDGDLSTEVSGKPIAPPANLAAVTGSASQENDISWDASTGATSYNLFFSTTPGVTTGDTELAGVTSPYTHTGITNDQIYYYRVEAVNADGDSDLSNEDDATPYGLPVAPTGVSVVSGDEYNSISFNSVAHADSYNIYWDTVPTITTGDTKITGVTSPHNHTSLVNGTTYYYRVEAENTRGVSPLSAEVNGTPAVPAPPNMDNKSNLNILAAVTLQTRGRV